METKLKIKLMGELPSKVSYKLVNIAEMLHQRIRGSQESKKAGEAAPVRSPLAYLLSSQRMHEIETQKAMVISLSRHEKWKAGGPV